MHDLAIDADLGDRRSELRVLADSRRAEHPSDDQRRHAHALELRDQGRRDAGCEQLLVATRGVDDHRAVLDHDLFEQAARIEDVDQLLPGPAGHEDEADAGRRDTLQRLDRLVGTDPHGGECPVEVACQYAMPHPLHCRGGVPIEASGGPDGRAQRSNVARTSVPLPSCDLISSFPLSPSARSRMVRSPK